MSTQPSAQQEITSQDNKLKILHHHGTIDYFGSFLIEGAVKNLSSEPDIEVAIHVDYFDENGLQIDTDKDLLYIPYPGGSRGFFIVYSGQRNDDIRSYKLYPVTVE
jgi:hypothetical protein